MKPSAPFNLRAFVTLLVGFAFTLMAVSGLALFFAPRGSFPFLEDWALLGLDREQWMALHFLASLTVLLIAAFHLYNNRKPFWNYLHGKAKGAFSLQRELVAAIVVTVALFFSALFNIPPASLLVSLNDALKDRFPRPSELRHPALEDMTLRELGEELGYSDAQMSRRLEGSELANISLDDTVGEVLQEHGLRLRDLQERLDLRGLRRRGGP